MYALIMAGGTGTRLWPRSRAAKPKQFLPLLGERTMLQETVERIRPLVPTDQIIIATGRDYTDLTAEQLPDVPCANIIGEPSGKGSAPCIGLGALAIRQDDPGGIMVVLSSDHQIQKAAVFREALKAAEELAQQGYLVTLGIQPTEPHTGYGYIHRRARLGQFNGFTAYEVERFVEKPRREIAEQYLQTGEYSWNAGIFIWRADAIMAAFAQHLPKLHQQLMAIEAGGGPNDADAFSDVWASIENITIDYGIMERAERVAVIPVDIGWSDVGDWDTLAALAGDGDNVIQAEHIGVDTHGTLVYSASDRLIATVGLDNFLVIDTGDALLVAPRDRAQDIKKIVDELKRQGRQDIL
ncbi:MAG TPA: mannose-1-phosphate guanylyltransferase [Herpetosiphonaceae bacterium]